MLAVLLHEMAWVYIATSNNPLHPDYTTRPTDVSTQLSGLIASTPTSALLTFPISVSKEN